MKLSFFGIKAGIQHVNIFISFFLWFVMMIIMYFQCKFVKQKKVSISEMIREIFLQQGGMELYILKKNAYFSCFARFNVYRPDKIVLIISLSNTVNF